DLCEGPHIENTGEIDAKSFTLTHLAGAYWRGDEQNPMLTRIYGLAFDTEAELDTYLAQQEEAKKRDHKKLGIELDLFTFSDLVGSGLPLWTPRGTIIRNLLDEYIWSMRQAVGYQKVEIPHITKKDLYEKSGHWDKFKDELFRITTREGHEFAMKPMNCPHHTQIYARRQWSYRELPQRYANSTACYRDEQSGELSGLSRVRAFTQDDAHVFCRNSQIHEEILKIWDIVTTFYGSFGFELQVRISKHDPATPEKFLGDKETWKLAEEILSDIAIEKNANAFEGIGEAAFYGPKLDFMAKDALGREWQVATIQLDMNMPERFDLFCINETGERERIVMIHAAIMGSIERFMSILIEHTAGAFPFWLAPVQVAILPVSEDIYEYAKGINLALKKLGYRTEMKMNETLGKRIRETKVEKIPYTLVLGKKEVEEKTVTLESYANGKVGVLPLPELLELLANDLREKR
ncbi:MAG: threonine--tRNA ligase, partial [Candidatus Moraniibacteriota bacterium]